VPGDIWRVHVAEGYADALALHRRSGDVAVAVHGSSGWRNFELARRFRGRRTWVWADPDERPQSRE